MLCKLPAAIYTGIYGSDFATVERVVDEGWLADRIHGGLFSCRTVSFERLGTHVMKLSGATSGGPEACLLVSPHELPGDVTIQSSRISDA